MTRVSTFLLIALVFPISVVLVGTGGGQGDVLEFLG
jgi:hypothetical protein